MEERIMMI